MANNLILVFLIVGGIIGWSLFAIALSRLIHTRQHEINMISDIKQDLVAIKTEIKSLK